MPEIAEVRRYVDQLTARFGGQKIQELNVIGGRFAKDGVDGVSCMCFPWEKVEFGCKGKFIYCKFVAPNSCGAGDDDDDHDTLFITLGMAGSFGEKNKHSAVEFVFDNDKIYYNDIRHFGTMKVEFGKYQLKKKLTTLGWDALAEPFVPKGIHAKIVKKNKTIAEALLEQKVFAGVGNYIRSEVLYLSKINPLRRCCFITENEANFLCENIIKVAKEAYAAGGATISTYSDMYGIAGTYFHDFLVYGKKHDPLGNPVERMAAPDGRTVHWVKGIQL